MNLYRISNCLSLYQLNELYRLHKLYEPYADATISPCSTEEFMLISVWNPCAKAESVSAGLFG
jgi:hypothetical protein